MKRLFKMLSLLSILLILGSCDSSKAINIDQIYSDNGYYNLTIGQTYKNQNNFTYTILGEVKAVSGADTFSFSPGVQKETLFKKGDTYTFYWEYISDDPSDLSGVGVVTHTFSSTAKSLKVFLYKVKSTVNYTDKILITSN